MYKATKENNTPNNNSSVFFVMAFLLGLGIMGGSSIPTKQQGDR
jgi:hypothetical protein